MTKGSLQGNTSGNICNQHVWPLARRNVSRRELLQTEPAKWARYGMLGALAARGALSLAVWAALHPILAVAAEEVWPETAPQAEMVPQPTSRPILPAAPLAPMATEQPNGFDAQTAGGGGFSAEPAPPGEGPPDVSTPADAQSGASPANSALDAAIIDQGGGSTNFWTPEIHAGLTTSLVFDDNIFITSQNETSDTISVTSARITLAFGNVQTWASRFIDTTARALVADAEEGGENLIALTYSPTAIVFFDNDSLNSVEHDVAGTARWTLSKLSIAFDGRVQTLSDPDEDLGRRADRTISRATFSATYDWTEKSRVQVQGNFVERAYDIGNDSTQYSGSASFLYDFMPKTTIGVSVGGGNLEVGQGDETFENVKGQLRYNSFSKVTFSISGGAELRQTVTGDDDLNGVFEIGFGYVPSEGSEFYLSAVRRVEPSADGRAQTIERTGLRLSYNQRLFQRLSLTTNLDYSLAEYATSTTSLNAGREDNVYSASATLTFEVTQNGFVRLGYIYRQNESSRDSLSYQSNQAIISATILF